MNMASPSPSLPSSTDTSDTSSDEEDSYGGEAGEYGASASRPGSPVGTGGEGNMPPDDQEADTMACQWEDCGKVFNHLPTLIDHIHNGEQRPSTL